MKRNVLVKIRVKTDGKDAGFRQVKIYHEGIVDMTDCEAIIEAANMLAENPHIEPIINEEATVVDMFENEIETSAE